MAFPKTTLIWLAGARPKTLPAAIIPVLTGTAVASDVSETSISWVKFSLAMAVAVCLQVAVNFANDFSDGRKGTDSPDKRKGPVRLVGSGAKSPRAVLLVAILFFVVAAVCGFILAVLTSYLILLAGALAIFAAWTYTGAPISYGYRAMGEVSVFIFFGLMATVGTTYVLVEEFPAIAWLCGIGIGALSTALLIANNFRDISGDRLSGKITLAVILGEERTRWLYVAMLWVAGIVVAFQAASQPWVAFAYLGLLLAINVEEKKITPNLGKSVLALVAYGIGLILPYWL